MLHAQKLITGLALLFLVAGLMFTTLKSPTGNTIHDLGNQKSTDLFCYESYLCQSGIECMYLDDKKPFCSHPATQDNNIAQKHGQPCQLINNKVSCPLEHQ